MPRKAFTVQEANDLMARLEELDERMQLLDVLWGERLYKAQNPDFPEFARCRNHIRRMVKEVEGMIQDEILARGVRFPPGGLEQGLLDFPTTLDGRWVFMCWQSGEARMESWHELDGGFAGRRPLTRETAWRTNPRHLDPTLNPATILGRDSRGRTKRPPSRIQLPQCE
jgi:hypothetical protein